jgi:histone H3/H4
VGVPRFAAAEVKQRIRRLAPKVADDVPEFMAAVLEVVTSQMLQRAGEAAAAGSCGRIEPQHIHDAMRHDRELASLAGSSEDVTSLESGGAAGAGGTAADEVAAEQGSATDGAEGGVLSIPGGASVGVPRFAAAEVKQRIRRLAPKVADDVPEFMAAVLEVVTSQMLQRAGEAAAAGSCGRIEPQHIHDAMRHDRELSALVSKPDDLTDAAAASTPPEPTVEELEAALGDW